MISEFQYHCLSSIIFVIGILGVLINRSSVIKLLVCAEVVLLAANINFVTASLVHGIEGYIFAMITLTVAAAEAAIGLAILVLYFRNSGDIYISKMNRLKG